MMDLPLVVKGIDGTASADIFRLFYHFLRSPCTLDVNKIENHKKYMKPSSSC